MRKLFKLFLLLIVVVLMGLGTVLVLSFEEHPLVAESRPLTPAEVKRAKALFEQNDPRRLSDGQIGTLALSQEDLALAMSHAIALFTSGGAQVSIGERTMAVRATAVSPYNPIGRYVNVDLEVTEGGNLPRVSRLRIGGVNVPRWLADFLLARAIETVLADEAAHSASDIVQGVDLGNGSMRVTYRWRSDAVDKVRSRLVSSIDADRVRRYHNRLVEAAAVQAAGAEISLAAVLRPLLVLAGERARDGDAMAENQAAIVVVADYVNGRGLGALVPESREWPKPRRHQVRTQGRTDLPQHFTTSAALAALGGTALSDAIGLYKEVDDSRGGSGFSFRDLAADRAGTRFGELATATTESAWRLQVHATRGLSDEDLLPGVHDLPEQMTDAEFERRYGGLEGEGYERMVAEIDRRIDAIAFFRP